MLYLVSFILVRVGGWIIMKLYPSQPKAEALVWTFGWSSQQWNCILTSRHLDYTASFYPYFCYSISSKDKIFKTRRRFSRIFFIENNLEWSHIFKHNSFDKLLDNSELQKIGRNCNESIKNMKVLYSFVTSHSFIIDWYTMTKILM